jgi:hypothetical protein
MVKKRSGDLIRWSPSLLSVFGASVTLDPSLNSVDRHISDLCGIHRHAKPADCGEIT